MEFLSDVDLSENSDNHNDFFHCQEETHKTSRFRRDHDEMEFETSQRDNKNYQQQDSIRTIIRCIIEDDEVTANNDLALREESSRPNGPHTGQIENDFKFKHTEKAKPGHPEVELLQEGTNTSTTSWNLNNWNNVVVHHCNDSCACMADKAGMYPCGSYQSQDSF